MIAALLLAAVVNPWMLTRHLSDTNRLQPRFLAAMGAVALTLNAVIPLGLQLLGIRIVPFSLGVAHIALAAVLAGLLALRRRPFWIHAGELDRRGLWLAALFALLVLPVTHLAGIDTYKWQDIASSVKLEGRVPWLIHPLSLYGFTPRSYPSLCPLALASIQTLGGLGVDGGFFVMSLLSGLTGLFAAWSLGARLFDNARGARWFAALYVLSPLFMRYNHWATGRGVFLALLPLLLISLLDLPAPRAWLCTALLALLLPAAHKAGIVAVPLLLIGLLISFLLPRRDHRWLLIALLVPFLLAALALSPAIGLRAPAGLAIGFARRAITRFGWYFLPAAIGLLFARGWFSRPAWRLLFPCMLLVFPFAFLPDMYGALVALPFVCWAAAAGLEWCFARQTTKAMALCPPALALLLTLAGGAAVVVNRDLHATPRAVWKAAMFLDAYDPAGPFRVDAEETVRKQVQAYVAGCPRFDVHAPAEIRIVLRRPPALRGSPSRVCRAWIDYLRNALAVQGADTDWYGRNPRLYMIVLPGERPPPPSAQLLYDRDGVRIFAPAGQLPR